MTQEQLRMQMLAGIITEGQYKQLLEDMEVVNRILDKISSEGINSLTPYEKKYLEAHSQGNKLPSPDKITWNWEKARITSEDDEGFVYKVWGENEMYNYYGEFYLPDLDPEGDRPDIEDKDIRENYGNFIYIAKYTKDTDELVDEIDPKKQYPDESGY